MTLARARTLALALTGARTLAGVLCWSPPSVGLRWPRLRGLGGTQAALRRQKAVEAEAEAKVKQQRKTEDEMLVLHARLQKKHEAMKAEQIRLAAEEKQIKFIQAAQAARCAAVIGPPVALVRGRAAGSEDETRV